jgi:hypothetical protein
MVIHPALLTAVHEQPLVAVTPVLRFPPSAATLCEGDERLKVQAVWVTVRVLLAIVRLPVLEFPEVFEATV